MSDSPRINAALKLQDLMEAIKSDCEKWEDYEDVVIAIADYVLSRDSEGKS